jgi:secreted trypsin-like serine protease
MRVCVRVCLYIYITTKLTVTRWVTAIKTCSFENQCVATGTAEMCPGYNGSPLVCVRQDTNTTVLAGMQMFTYSCMEQGAPSVYTEVAALRDWADYVSHTNPHILLI